MCDADSELSETLPEVSLGPGRGFPRAFQYLVCVEGTPAVQQSLRLDQRLAWR
jgi:hypothetical protein